MPRIRRTIREQVTEQIRDHVLAGKLEPGQPLREADFAERFGVSRGPVRDAFLLLAQEGLLAYQANRGVTVQPPLEEASRGFIVSLRRQVERFSVDRGLETLEADAVAELAERLAELRRACESGDVVEIARGDLAFHETLLVACGGAEFLPVWRWLCSRMLLTYTRLDSYNAVYAEHLAIFEAVECGDAGRVVATLARNIQ